MNNINLIKNNISGKNISVLGSGISGQGAANLAHYLGANVLLSDKKSVKNLTLISDKIKIESPHTENCLNADLVIISPGIDPNTSEIVKDIIRKKIPIVSEIEFGSWSTKNPIIAITGSNGKSTVVKLVNSIFNKKYSNVMLGGNIGVSFCMNIYIELKNNLKTLHILEISSFQLQNIYDFKPDLSCILNITRDHIERHITFENYCQDKLKIVKNTDKNSHIVYNQDDYILDNIFIKNKAAVPFSIKHNTPNIKIKCNKIYCSKTNKQILNQENTNLIGLHNLSNIVAAIQISKIYRIENKIIKKVIEGFKPLEHRMEVLDINSNIVFINDSKGTNLVSTLAAIQSIKNDTLLILGGYSDDKISKDSLDEISDKKNIYKVVCYGEIGKTISKHFENSKYEKEFSDAVSFAIKFAIPNSTLLLSPGFKSFDQFSNFEDRGKMFKNIIFKHFA
ncbi:UDP-N-acetylmuramoyl-L-alanine--D-glutamate ligase [Candidatus Marinimicrobia bacterium]|nr:UDP-N-acetylmuramoyl-L-alanine--D-glutamate ligase [Candidatus Neomarinimicrobiota bacterium]